MLTEEMPQDWRDAKLQRIQVRTAEAVV